MEEFNILVCDDDHSIVDAIEIYLKQEGYRVIKAYNGLEALKALEENEIHLIILDIMMPQLDGLQATVKIREICNIPILMLSAKSEDYDKITGLNVGADDYVTKPFSIPILLRKIAAILRRTQREDELQVISYKTLSVDVKGHHVYICKAEKGEQIEVELTQKEFEMLYVLLINKGIVLTRQKLLNMVWGEDYYGEERIVDTHIKNIRKKLGVNLISTIRGVGYRIDKEN